MKFYRPIICGETGFWGGAFCCVAPPPKAAFKMLERRIAAGKITKVPYAR
ncbi:hypothetical protein [Bradyrhizobium elkanii]|uniref:Uncharacterized protein n=1 Tax=Bradyrhizobium diazoefficiens TaxID=1355477 RepID=A0A809X7A5_9BRAD|nr:hypothetical protein [Bradyrhizobium elkanii]BCE22071.1 hypothetical protein XF1B_47520 [Bradyrhizobium diazoefficiens]WLB04127.1 hypothetical protein QNJ80_19940 [Bradyrhizobium elkanii]WLB84938.1 hypothetical protein QIH83_21275 [Bradyrhizobium elkanii]BCE48336.1 hypothetical protein XF4B_46850 [Bradyrhizobium diazoefficiens]BCE91852.1 hypothetical protein XF10B_46500 [Bradyrhizobium diazoefficiens]